MSLESAVTAAASRNTQLLSTLAETDHAIPYLKHQHSLISDLSTSLAQLDKRITQLTAKRIEEQKDHDSYNDSFFRRHAHQVVGKKEKFSAKAEKEEREYFEALRDETLVAKQDRDELQSTLDDAKRVLRDTIEPAARKHEQAQILLDELYDSLFDGPTPSFPEEDALEQSASRALDNCQVKKDELLREEAAKGYLQKAMGGMYDALQSVDAALSASTWYVMGGGTWADMMERDALSSAQRKVNGVLRMVDQTMRASNKVQAPPEMRVVNGHVMSDMIFDNIFTDMVSAGSGGKNPLSGDDLPLRLLCDGIWSSADIWVQAMHERIEETQRSIARGAVHIRNQDSQCLDRLRARQTQMGGEEQRLGAAREGLQECRRRAIGTITKGGQLWVLGVATALTLEPPADNKDVGTSRSSLSSMSDSCVLQDVYVVSPSLRRPGEKVSQFPLNSLRCSMPSRPAAAMPQRPCTRPTT